MLASSTANIEGWTQVGELGLALLLSAAIGVEREIHQKNAGLRTHTLVGVGAALFVLLGKYGFSDVLEPGRVVVDPSRVAAQVVTGVGFLGAGLIFVRRDSVRGLTTAAAVWVTAAVGAAAGAGLPVLAACATGAYFVVVVVLPPIARHLPRSSSAVSEVRVRYVDGEGVLRQVLGRATSLGFFVAELATEVRGRGGRRRPGAGGASGGEGRGPVEVTLQVYGTGDLGELVAALSELEGVESVGAEDAGSTAE
ncbi:MAG: MgtC/SapB family protein [Acidimicrobiales bacterium]